MAGDGSGFDAYNVIGGYLFYNQGTWYMYYSGRSTTPNSPGTVIGRATAQNPYGPWTTSDDTVLTVGSAGEWDSEFLAISSIVQKATGLNMYYWAGNAWPGSGHQIGLATSTDGGVTWNKFNDPSTTNPPYAESDPVLPLGQPGSIDDFAIVGCSVLKTSTQWEMFYAGKNGDTNSICYATSSDGIVWKKDPIPILTSLQDPFATIGILEVPSVIVHNDIYFLYYDYGIMTNGIGLATSVPVAIKPLYDNNPDRFELKQNYPNPFSPSTTIEFSIPKTEFVTLKIYNLLGQEVATLVSQKLAAGSYKYDWDAGSLASGVYLYRVQAGEFKQNKKMVLIK